MSFFYTMFTQLRSANDRNIEEGFSEGIRCRLRYDEMSPLIIGTSSMILQLIPSKLSFLTYEIFTSTIFLYIFFLVHIKKNIFGL